MSATDEKDSATPEDTTEPHKSTRVRRMKACKQCHSLKVRCTPVNENDPYLPCVRCVNSNKQCEIDLDQPRKRRKRTSKKDGESITELHDQIAHLQQQLRAARSENSERSQLADIGTPRYYAPNTLNASDKQSPPFISKLDLEREISNLYQENFNLGEILEEIRTEADYRQEMLHKDRKVDVISAGIISIDEASRRLDVYRDLLYAAHPLVEISREVTAEQLVNELPFLFNAIMTTSSMLIEDEYDRNICLALENHAVQGIVIEVMVAGTKSVELLKALILFSLWYNSPEFFKLRRYHILNCVAVTLLHDLGIVNRTSFAYNSDAKLIQRSDENYKSLEYRSLIMILYFSTVSICLILRRTIFVKWTPYVNECCEMLEQLGNDNYKSLANFLRLNHELERIHSIIHLQDGAERTKLSKYTLGEFQTNLAIIKSKLHPEDHRHRAYYYSVEAYLYQPALPDVQLTASSPVGCSQKLDSDTLSAIAHCTSSCLCALDEFSKLQSTEIAGLPLFYCSRIIYTAGILMRLRYLILSLPTLIEKEMVPKYAIVAIQKLNSQFGEAQKKFPGNFYLKKMRLILQLFVQTYVTQVMDLLKRNDDYIPTTFATPGMSSEARDELVGVASTLQGVNTNPMTESQAPYPTSLPLDLLSFAAATFHKNGETKEGDARVKIEKSPVGSNDYVPSESAGASNVSGVSNSTMPPPGSIVAQQPGSTSSYNINGYSGPNPENLPRNGPLQKAQFNPQMAPNAVFSGTTNDGYLVAPLSNVQEVMTQLSDQDLTTQGNSFFNIDDEFWSNLLSTDSNKFHFAQSEPLQTDNVMFMT